MELWQTILAILVYLIIIFGAWFLTKFSGLDALGRRSGIQWWNHESFSDEELWNSDGDVGRPYREKQDSNSEELYDYSLSVKASYRKRRRPTDRKPRKRPTNIHFE